MRVVREKNVKRSIWINKVCSLLFRSRHTGSAGLRFKLNQISQKKYPQGIKSDCGYYYLHHNVPILFPIKYLIVHSCTFLRHSPQKLTCIHVHLSGWFHFKFIFLNLDKVKRIFLFTYFQCISNQIESISCVILMQPIIIHNLIKLIDFNWNWMDMIFKMQASSLREFLYCEMRCYTIIPMITTGSSIIVWS